MEWFSTEEELSAWKNRDKRLTAAFRILAAAAVIAFIVLCTQVRTENARTLHPVLIGVTAAAGWICIAVWKLGIKETRTQCGHLEMLLKGDKEIREGRITLTRESVRIPRSIRIRKVLLDTGGEEPARLNLDERWIGRMPPDGSRVRLALTHSYIAGVETLEEGSGIPEGRGASRRPATLRKAVKLVPLLVIWAFAAMIISSFVFYQITDTAPANKLTLYVDGQVSNEAQLASLLEKELGGSVRMVQVHPFSYFMFGADTLRAGDLFIVPDSDREQFADWFVPGEEGVTVHDPEAGESVAGIWILYAPEETYRLYVGAGSPHLEDGLARKGAELLMNLKTEEETR